MIARRDWLKVMGAVALVAPFGAYSQQPGKVWRIGYLGTAAGPSASVDAFREQLRTLGYVEGRNVTYEFRWTAGREEHVQELAEELVRLKVDLMVTQTSFVTLAAKRATSTIPIVMTGSANAVGAGVIASLARPGGNITGVTGNATETDAKRLQLLREVVPKATRVATLVWDKSIVKPLFIEQLGKAAKQMGMTIIQHEVSAPEGFEAVFAAMQRARAQALVVQSDAFTNSHRKRIVDLAARYRLPAIYQNSPWMDEGGLMYYGASGIAMTRLAATYVDRILKGAKPADLPVEEPTQYELVVNLKTARALGLTIPQAVLLRAEVIR